MDSKDSVCSALNSSKEPDSRPSVASQKVDKRPDFRWISRNSNFVDYLEQPWAHSRDVQQAFFDCRISKRDEFLRNVSPGQRSRIEREIERIRTLRQELATSEGRNQLLMQSMATRLRRWRECVKTQAPLIETAHIEYRERNSAPTRKDSTSNSTAGPMSAPSRGNGDKKGQEDPELVAMRRRLSVLEAERAARTVQSLDRDGPGLHHDIMARVLYFRRIGGDEAPLWEGFAHENPHFGDEDFPNQSISMHDLMFGTKNPLMPSRICPRDQIQHFHIPANNMKWIEVSGTGPKGLSGVLTSVAY